MRRLYYIKDEVGMVLNYYPTLKEMRSDFDWYIKQGMEPDTGHIDYIPTKVGVAALLNMLKEEA
jgi:hypothetical protein